MPNGPTRGVKCKAHNREGDQCKRWAVAGLEVCRMHGGATDAALAKAERARTEAAIAIGAAKFGVIVPADDPEASPIAAFEVEFRRTLGRIRWYDEQIAGLTAEQIVWGRTKVEEIGASEFTGRNTTYEAREHALVTQQRKEREHLLAMTKVWIGARMDERKLDIQRGYVKALDNALVGILTKLGLDVSDPATRQVVRDELVALPMREARS